MSEMEIPEGRIPLDPERIEALARYAVETHHEAAQLKALVDRGVQQTPEIEEEGEDGEPELHLWFDLPAEEIARMQAINPEVPDRLHIAAWPLADCLPSQN